ncbi:unnamed protein product [Darwinula stevensoni]|uniref:thioredoxin-disulfide reductase (NADPH) n=1 Tax=Darwinula stevensoni TaxID=69355 RepID=A0A7R8ZX78_9CRUS|nr:unnamed protein product [Darwinula stevensoni]CAG0878856.1 unnamed protein product [Darwinula stevensoni]
MAPIEKQDVGLTVQNYIKDNSVVVFSKSFCPFCHEVKSIFQTLGVNFHALELDLIEDGDAIQRHLLQLTGLRTVPNIFIKQKHIGGADKLKELQRAGRLKQIIQGEMAPTEPAKPKTNYDYDLVVIGGGSGGLSASKEAASLGMKVAVFDYVIPTPLGTTWGLGGTCVNVGCIPKKLMHQAALLGQAIKDAKSYGWEVPDNVNHKWEDLVMEVQNYIGSLNWGYRVALRDKNVDYFNAFASFVDPHTVKSLDKKKKEKVVTAEKFIIATGLRPRYPDIPGATEYGITSDDIFSLPYPPGKTLCVGASYVSLECAGFLHGVGFESAVMVRSILLRGFDQQMANLVGGYMEQQGIRFIKQCIPTKIEKIEDGTPPTLRVTGKYVETGEEIIEEFNTVLFAIGRDACTKGIGLEDIDVKINPQNQKVICDKSEQSTQEHIHAIGDILDGKLELTPVAIHAGKLLARRLFAGRKELTDYVNVPTTVFTPLEYGCVGFSEEAAIQKYGEENIEVYHTHFTPLEFTVSHRDDNACYGKLVCVKSEEMRVIGFHVLGPNAGEMTQGFALAVKMGAKKSDFESLIGIHPTNAETFTTLDLTRRLNPQPKKTGC